MAIDYRLLDLSAASKGIEEVNGWADAAAKRRAGALIAEDPAAAEAVLNRNGLLGDAMNVRQNVWAEENRAIAATQRGRDEEDRQRKIQMEAEKREAETLGTMATNLQTVMTELGPEAVLPAFDQMVSGFMAKGATQEQIAQMRQALEADAGRFLTATAGAVSAANQRYQMWQQNGSVGTFDRRTGKVDEQFRAPQYKAVATGQDLVEIPGSGGASDAAPAPAGGRPASGAGAREGTPQERNVQLQSEIKAAIPNAVMGSGVRTPERQAELVRQMPGIAVPNSRHPTGDAQDFQIPGKGRGDLPEVTAMLRQAGVEFEDVIYHNNHFHIERGPNGGSAPRPQGEAATGGPRVVARGRERAPTAEWRTMSSDEARNAGLREGGSYQVNTVNGQTRTAQAPPAAGRNGSTPGSVPRLSPQENGDIQKIKTQARELAATATLYEEWMSLNRQVATGGLMALPGAATGRGALDPRIARMNAIQARLTPQMRQGMPGAASDRDVQMFGRSTVSVGAPREANEATARAGIAFARRQGDYSAFMEQYARDNGTTLGAQEQWDEYTGANPLFEEGRNGLIRTREVTPWRSYFGRTRAPAGRNQPQGAPAPRPQGGSGQRRRYNPATGALE